MPQKVADIPFLLSWGDSSPQSASPRILTSALLTHRTATGMSFISHEYFFCYGSICLGQIRGNTTGWVAWQLASPCCASPHDSLIPQTIFHDISQDAAGKGSVWSGVANLSNVILGSGIIGLPYAVQQSGLILGVLLLLFTAWIADYALRLVVEAGRWFVGSFCVSVSSFLVRLVCWCC